MKKKRKSKVVQKPTLQHKIGDKHFVDGVACEVSYINAGTAWLTPVLDDPEDGMVARHIAYAKIDKYGKAAIL